MYELRCRDVGFDCPGIVRGETKDEILQQAAAHAASVHGVNVTPELAAKVSSVIRDAGSSPSGSRS